jgi:glycosyltransferase involved in cell wall biosynthesis
VEAVGADLTKMEAKVTVLMPVFNVDRYLDDAIKSILGQTLKEFELLIIDDASTDRSAEIVLSFPDPRIRYLQNRKNIGIAASLNRGIGAARTELIARMDGDDLSHPERLRKQVEYMSEHSDCAMLSTLTRNVGEEGELLGKNKLNPEFYYFSMTFFCWIYHPSVIYRKSIIEGLGGYPSRLAEDYLLWSRLIRRHRFATLGEYLLDYRITRQSTCNAVKRLGYASAEKEQIRDNLCYFMGDRYTIPDSWLECYRNNVDPIITHGSIFKMAGCIRELERVARAVARKPNVNCDPAAVLRAAQEKRVLLLRTMVKRLGFFRRIGLLLALGSLGGIGRMFLAGVGRKLEAVIASVRACKPI